MKTINKKTIIFLGLFLFVFLCSEALAYDIYGKVYKSDCSASISGSTVKLYNYTTGDLLSSTTTDATGSYRFSGVVRGSYNVEASAAGYITQTKKVTITSYSKSQNFCLSQPGTINGKVTELDGSTPVSGATVEAKLLGGSTKTATTASDGTYTITNLQNGSYIVTASAAGYLSSSQSANVTAGAIITVNFSLTKESVIKGKVTRSDGAPISGASVELKSATSLKTTSTDSNGNYTFNASAGTYDMKAYAFGYGAQLQVNVQAASGQTTTVDFVLPAEGWIKGQVTAGTVPLQGAAVEAIQMGKTIWTYSTNADGNYTIPNVAGTYDVKVSVAGYGTQTQTGIVVLSGQTTIVNFSFTPPGNISGRVTQNDGVTAISGATVQALQGGLVKGSATTDATGNYTIANLAPGTYDAKASATGYAAKTQTGVSVTSGQTTIVNLSLDPLPGSISGKITQINGVTAIYGALVEALQGGLVKGSATTNIIGSYTIANLAPGTYDVRASATGYLPQTSTGVIVTAGQTTTKNISLSQPGNITGKITKEDGVTAIQGALVEALQGTSVIGSATTDSLGNYTISNLTPGAYDVRASASGYSTKIQTGITVTSGQTTTLNMSLQFTPGNISGKITQADGVTAIAGALVEALQGTSVIGSATTNATGDYTISSLAQGTYDVRASATGYLPQTSTGVIVTSGLTTTANISLAPLGSISGKITREDGITAVSGALVEALQGGLVKGSATTDASGNYTIANLAPGTYDAKASATGYAAKTQTGVSVTSGQTTTVNLSLDPIPGNISGRITRNDGTTPIQGALVEALQGGIVRDSATTDATGDYTIANLAPGTYDVRASANGYLPQTSTGVIVTSEQTTTKNISLSQPPPGITYIYDENTNGIGRLTTMIDYSGASMYAYDKKGRQLSATKTVDGINYLIQKTYDSMDRVTSITYPDNEKVSYAYNAQGLIESVPGYVNNINYNEANKPIYAEYSNSVNTIYQYNAQNLRLYSITSNSPTDGLQNLAYTYDNVGNVMAITDLADNTKTQSFAYDDLDRLTQANGPYGAINYQYNQIGNMTYNSQTGAYAYGTKPHAVTQAGTNTYSYDANGNMISGAGRTLIYDHENKPVSINSLNIVYDGNGARVKKGSTVYIEKLYECTGSSCTKYIFVGDKRVALKRSTGEINYYSTDHLGSTTVVTDAVGAKAEEIRYYPYGLTLSDTGSVSLSHKYTSQELDSESNLYYYGARYYDPALSKFISPDPIEPDYSAPQELNKYSYVLNNPLKYVDPSGGVVLIGGHIAAEPVGYAYTPKAPSYHLYLILIPDRPRDFTDRTGWFNDPHGYMYATLGGQMGGNKSWYNPLGNLQSKFNYEGDSITKAMSTFIQVVDTPKGMTDTQFINNLINAAVSYKNDLNYDLFPELTSGYNSNSYVSGIIIGAGGIPPALETNGLFQTPGYFTPIPLPSLNYSGSTGSSTNSYSTWDYRDSSCWDNYDFGYGW